MKPVGKKSKKLSRKGMKGGGKRAHDSSLITKHQVGAGGRVGGRATRNTAMQHWDQSPAGD